MMLAEFRRFLAKRNSKIGALLCLLCLFSSGCHHESASTPVQFEMKDWSKSENNCPVRAEGCSYLDFHYPLITQAATPEVKKQLNDNILLYLSEDTWDQEDAGKGKIKDLEQVTQNFFAGAQKERKESKYESGSYFTEKNVKIRFSSPDIVAMEFKGKEYTGGAHPNYYTELSNFKTKDGSKISLAELFQADSLPKLTAIAEKHFRDNQKIPSDKTLKETGYFFDTGVFKLPDNFSISSTGITFLFNPYEAAPYALGDISFDVPYEELKDILKPEGLISQIQKNTGK